MLADLKKNARVAEETATGKTGRFSR
jgi:hypothetical protein